MPCKPWEHGAVAGVFDEDEPMRTITQRDGSLSAAYGCLQIIDNDARPLALQGPQHGLRGEAHATPNGLCSTGMSVMSRGYSCLARPG